MGSPPQHHRDRHRLAARLVLVAHLPAVLAGRDVEARGLGVVDHHAIGAAIDPALVGIAGDVEAAGADVAAAVAWRAIAAPGNVVMSIVVAGHDVLRSSGRRRRISAGCASCRRHEVGAEAFAQLDLGQVGREAERHVLALAAEEVDQHAAARRSCRARRRRRSTARCRRAPPCSDTMPMSCCQDRPLTCFTSPSFSASSSHLRRS